MNPLDAHGAQGFVVISGSFTHDAYKYSNRSLPYVLLEAGHAAQNVHLSALEEGLATLEMGGFFDNSLKRFLDYPLEYEPLVMIAFGYESHAADEAPASPGLEVRWAELYADTYRLPFHMAFAGVADREGAIDWSCGRANDPATALLKASAEVEEREANAAISNLVAGTWHEVREYAVDPRSIVMYHESQYRRKSFPFARFDEASVYQWTWGDDVLSGERRLLLSDAVYFPYTPTYARYTAANSSGSAAYSNLQGAIERGALELIEREAFLVTWVNCIAAPRLRITTLPQPIALRLSALQHEHFVVAVLCVDYLMPTFIWVARSGNFEFATVSACASFTPEEALERSLMELEASIYCRFSSGTVANTLRPRSVRKVYDHGLIYEQQRYLSRIDFLFGGGEQSFGECRSRFADWNALAQYLAQECQRVYAVKLTRNQDQAVARDLEVVKVFIPGLVPMSFGYGTEPCGIARMYSAPVTAGYLPWPKTFRQLNCFPHPFT